jgi:sporulation protein YlmC with PRC-barrel domain
MANLNPTEGYGSKENFDVIAADKVEGTNVYNMAGDKVGSIRNVMIDKISGKVVYATMAFGGVLGMGQKYHALPWNVLKYNTELGGYQTDIDRDRLEQGPSATEEELTGNFRDQDWGRKVYDYYGSSWTA